MLPAADGVLQMCVRDRLGELVDEAFAARAAQEAQRVAVRGTQTVEQLVRGAPVRIAPRQNRFGPVDARDERAVLLEPPRSDEFLQ
jgi:hypothetical protein